MTKKGKAAAIIVVFGVLAAFVGREITYYSAEPSAEKDCNETAAKDSYDPLAVFETTLQWMQKGGSINDASCINKTDVYGIVQVKSPDDVKKALTFAKQQKLKVSIAGVRHSMGGQAFYKNAVILDMRTFKEMSLDKDKKILTVQAGATWHDIQNYLHPTYAVLAMQSTDIFTVGGSISVNAHGMDHTAGSIYDTIEAMTVMMADGSIKRLSKTQNADLFRHVVGGYGLFGVVLDADLKITDNTWYESERAIIDYKQFPELFKTTLATDKNLGLFYGHLSTAPESLLSEMILYSYKKPGEQNLEPIPPLTEVGSVKLRRLVLNLSKHGPLAMKLKWWSEKHIEPKIETCFTSRNQAMKDGEGCLVSRNEPMHDSVKYLKNNLKNDADILHEYFVPRDKFEVFVEGLRNIVKDEQAIMLNASVRIVKKEDIVLSYAPKDSFSVVLYFNQTADKAGNEKMKRLTGRLIDLTSSVGGRFFLPYQLHYTNDQLLTAYPEIPTFFAAKKKYDPELRLTNTWYEKYASLSL